MKALYIQILVACVFILFLLLFEWVIRMLIDTHEQKQ